MSTLRCKIFRERSSGDLEGLINDWLEVNDGVTIVQIAHSEDTQYGTVIIFYTRKLEMTGVK
jgi:hypothetical protein